MTPDALTTLTDALASNDLVVIGVAVVAVLVPLVLKALGKEVPLLDPLLRVAVGLTKSLRKKPAPAEPPKEGEGVAAVVPIKKADPQEDLK